MAWVLAVLAAFPALAEAQERRACRATGYFFFTFQEIANGSLEIRTKRIDILQSDMEVVATSAGQTWNTVTDAKRWACEGAASCYVRQASGGTCEKSLLGVIYETVKRPEPIDEWRRQVACYHAGAGNVPGIAKTAASTVTLVQTKIVATASRDSITRNADVTVNESNHVCWSPSPAGDRPPNPRPAGPRPPRPSRTDASHQPARTDASHQPTRTDASQQPTRTDAGHQPTRTDAGHQPTRTDASHQPTRTDGSHQPTRTDGGPKPSRTNPSSPIASIQLTVTPPAQQGNCPASVLMQAHLELRRPAEVRWWITGENGYQSAKYVRDFSEPSASLFWRRQITQPAGTTTYKGYFQLHFESVAAEGRAIPLGESDPIAFTVECTPQL